MAGATAGRTTADVMAWVDRLLSNDCHAHIISDACREHGGCLEVARALVAWRAESPMHLTTRRVRAGEWLVALMDERWSTIKEACKLYGAAVAMRPPHRDGLWPDCLVSRIRNVRGEWLDAHRLEPVISRFVRPFYRDRPHMLPEAIADMRDAHARTLVLKARANNELVGAIVYTVHADHVFIEQLHVKKEWRKQKVATVLLAYAASFELEMRLYVWRDNTTAIAAYSKMGFVEITEMERETEGMHLRRAARGLE